jgi:glycosidase
MGLREHRYPSLYQVNTRVWLRELAESLGERATLDDIRDSELDRIAHAGFDWIWFLGVWQSGLAGQRVSLESPEWQAEFRAVLPDLQRDDVCGSCFEITKYAVHSDFGGDAALERLRDKLHERGMRLLLDFVPNHTALDHPWVERHPEFYVRGTEEQLHNEPQNYVRVEASTNPMILAYGRDPILRAGPIRSN